MKGKEDEHDTRVSSYLRLVAHNQAFGILFLGELIDNVSGQLSSYVNRYMLLCRNTASRQHHLHTALFCLTTLGPDNFGAKLGSSAALQLLLQPTLH